MLLGSSGFEKTSDQLLLDGTCPFIHGWYATRCSCGQRAVGPESEVSRPPLEENHRWTKILESAMDFVRCLVTWPEYEIRQTVYPSFPLQWTRSSELFHDFTLEESESNPICVVIGTRSTCSTQKALRLEDMMLTSRSSGRRQSKPDPGTCTCGGPTSLYSYQDQWQCQFHHFLHPRHCRSRHPTACMTDAKTRIEAARQMYPAHVHS
jgi:hypothetical protein